MHTKFLDEPEGNRLHAKTLRDIKKILTKTELELFVRNSE
jgi:hypothetical protein